jgi:type II secretory pathway pseudopilin PulG
MNDVGDRKSLKKVTMHPFVDQRGMTVPEILAAVVVIMVALVALASAIPLSAYGIQEGSQLTTATFLANQRLEQVKLKQWTVKPDVDDIGVSASATAAPQKAGGITTFPDESPVAAPYTQFTRTVRISDCVAGAGCGTGIVDPAGQRQVTVAVSYRPLTGQGQAAAGTTKSAIVTLVVAKR